MLNTYQTELPDKWNGYTDKISGQRFRNIRRKIRNLNKIGEVKLVVAQGKKEKHSIIGKIIFQKRKRGTKEQKYGICWL